jgi:uncharacterized membrane protein
MATAQKARYTVVPFKNGFAVIDTAAPPERHTRTLAGEVVTRSLVEEQATEFCAALNKENKANG